MYTYRSLDFCESAGVAMTGAGTARRARTCLGPHAPGVTLILIDASLDQAVYGG